MQHYSGNLRDFSNSVLLLEKVRNFAATFFIASFISLSIAKKKGTHEWYKRLPFAFSDTYHFTISRMTIYHAFYEQF